MVTLPSEWRKSHWCFRERHHASIMEFENFSSVKAKTAQHSRRDQIVDLGIHVLDARVRQHDRSRL